MQKKTWLRFLQILVTLVLSALLVRQVDWATFGQVMTRLGWRPVLLSFGFILISHLIIVARWRWLLPENTASYGVFLVLYGAGLFSNNFLPSGVGGDGVRAVMLKRYVPWPLAVLSVILDRFIGMASLAVLLILGETLGSPFRFDLRLSSWLNPNSRWLWLLAVLLGLGTGFALWKFPAFRQWMTNLRRRYWPTDLPQWPFNRWLRLVLFTYGISVVSQMLLVGASWVLVKGLALQAPFAAAIWLVVISALATLLPISVNGLGIQENVYVLILGLYGVAATPAFSVALILRVLMIILSLLGGLLSLVWRPDALKGTTSLHL